MLQSRLAWSSQENVKPILPLPLETLSSVISVTLHCFAKPDGCLDFLFPLENLENLKVSFVSFTWSIWVSFSWYQTFVQSENGCTTCSRSPLIYVLEIYFCLNAAKNTTLSKTSPGSQLVFLTSTFNVLSSFHNRNVPCILCDSPFPCRLSFLLCPSRHC